jgi:hypothetical protein
MICNYPISITLSDYYYHHHHHHHPNPIIFQVLMCRNFLLHPHDWGHMKIDVSMWFQRLYDTCTHESILLIYGFLRHHSLVTTFIHFLFGTKQFTTSAMGLDLYSQVSDSNLQRGARCSWSMLLRVSNVLIKFLTKVDCILKTCHHKIKLSSLSTSNVIWLWHQLEQNV